MPRLILIPLATVLILLVAAVILIPLILDEDRVLELAATTLREETGATLTVAGQSSISIFPSVNVSLADAAITMPGKSEPDLKVRSLQIGVALLPLFSGSVEIDRIHLDGVTTRLESSEEQASADGAAMSDEELDAFYAARRKAMADAGKSAGAEAVVAVPLALKVAHLIMTDSRLEIVDPATGDSTVVEIVRLETTDLNLEGKPLPASLTLRVVAEQPIEVTLDGIVRIDQKVQTVLLDEIKVVVSGATAQPIMLQSGGTIDLSRQVADLQLALATGETAGSGTLRYASFESPQIDTRLQLNLFDPALLALAGPEAASAADSPDDSTSGDEPLPLDAIRLIDTRAHLTIEQAVFGAHAINNMVVNIRAVEGIVRVNALSGELHGGKLDLKGVFNGKHNTASLNTSGSLTDMDITAALTATGSGQTVSGNATMNWRLSSKGRSMNELIGSLQGPIKLQTREVTLQEMSVEHMLCQAVALTNKETLTAQFPDSTRFQSLTADVQLAQGKAQLRPLRAELPHIALKGTGAFDLLSQDFNATVKASLSPELEQLDRACRVSKRLTAIDWPVNCKGNVATDPAQWCGVDTEEIIEDLAKYEGKRRIEKEAGKLLDKLFK